MGILKIKKISEDKVQIIITNQDLEERDFKKWELMPISPKAQELFQDLLEMAYQECGFEIDDDSQLIVEAYPLSVDSFVIIMTKIRPSTAENINTLITQHRDEDTEEIPQYEHGNSQIWKFFDLETCCQATNRVEPDLIEDSALYKHNDKYYLSVSFSLNEDDDVSAIFGEYGEWIPVDESFFKEYGEILIKRDAVINLASIIR